MEFTKDNLNKAFKALRALGMLARQSFLCCSNCAGTALANDAEKMVDAGKTPKGCVFYHRQDAAALVPPSWDRPWRSRRPADKRTLMIRYGKLDTNKHGNVGLPTVEVGKLVCKTFDECGVPYEWDGNPDSCIQVIVQA
jgi:hypothetical protein